MGSTALENQTWDAKDRNTTREAKSATRTTVKCGIRHGAHLGIRNRRRVARLVLASACAAPQLRLGFRCAPQVRLLRSRTLHVAVHKCLLRSAAVNSAGHAEASVTTARTEATVVTAARHHTMLRFGQ